MTLGQALHRARETLGSGDIEHARLEAEVLLMHVLKLERAQLYSQFERELSPGDTAEYHRLIHRRLKHEPTAYITGHREFYGLDFHLDPRVLIPRPESELLVETGLNFIHERYHDRRSPFLIADVGTGSGAIAISLALSLPSAIIYATDVSPAALEVTAINCQRYGVEPRVHLLTGDMLEPLTQPVNLVLANLPYVRDADMESLSPEIRLFEPLTALASGKDGLDKVRQLLSQIESKLLPGGAVLLEVGQGQAREVISLSRQHFPDVQTESTRDLAGIERVVRIIPHPEIAAPNVSGLQ